jgi:hypothetical protein
MSARTHVNGKHADHMARARAYFRKIPPAVQTLNGRQLTSALRLIYDRFDLDADQFRQIAAEYSETCNPPWLDHELDHAIKNIRKDPSKQLWLQMATGDMPDRLRQNQTQVTRPTTRHCWRVVTRPRRCRSASRARPTSTQKKASWSR